MLTDGLWGRTKPDRLCVLGRWLDALLRDLETCEFHLSSRKLELVGREHKVVLVAVTDNASDPVEGLFHCLLPGDDVVNNLLPVPDLRR